MIDEQLGVLYVATGDNYSEPATDTSDAVIAIDLKSGKLLWSKQVTSDDVFNNSCSTPQRTNCQRPPGPDYDFGQSPILVSLSAGEAGSLCRPKGMGCGWPCGAERTGRRARGEQ
jgi:polyvinyl alcohol dehydrogenase (cytochrome)